MLHQRDTCIIHVMKKLTALLIISPIILPLPMHARGIGDYARDYSARLEQRRLERERIGELRRARINERLKARRKTRSRAVIKKTATGILSTEERLNRRKKARAMLEQKRWARIEDRRIARTRKEGAENMQDRAVWRLDARRRVDLGSIIEIFSRYVYEPNLPNADLLPTSEKEICRTRVMECGGVNLDKLIIGSGMKVFPHDPEIERLAPGTGYSVQKTSSGGVMGLLMKAPKGNGGEGIEIDWKCPKCSN